MTQLEQYRFVEESGRLWRFPKINPGYLTIDVRLHRRQVALLTAQRFPHDPLRVWLHHLKVERLYRRQGIGESLLDRLVTWARPHCSEIEIAIMPLSDELSYNIQQWYAQHGFFMIGRAEEGEALMTLNLKR